MQLKVMIFNHANNDLIEFSEIIYVFGIAGLALQNSPIKVASIFNTL